MYGGGDTTQFEHCWQIGPQEIPSRNKLLERAGARLMKLTRRMLRKYPHLCRWEQTDDVYQNAVLRLYRSLGDVHPDSIRAFFGLAVTQIRRTLIDLARHHFGPEGQAARHQSQGYGSDGPNLLDSKPSRGDEPPETLAAWAQFHEAVEQLPTEEHEAFSLIWYGDATQKEAAEVLDVSGTR